MLNAVTVLVALANVYTDACIVKVFSVEQHILCTHNRAT